MPVRGAAGTLPLEIKREEFEELISSYVARIDMLVETALDEAGTGTELESILLVGGSTRIPAVRERIRKMFGRDPVSSVNVDECVALGAAIHAGLAKVEKGERVSAGVAAGLKDMKLNDVSNHCYGTICVQPDPVTRREVLANDTLIEKNQQLPCEVKKTYYTIAPDQRTIRVRVTQSVDPELDPEMANIIGDQEMQLPAGRPAGRPVEVTYSYDRNQRMHCIFLDRESGQKLELDFDLKNGGLNKAEVARRKAKLADFVVE